jgi:glycosyltransferase involved in cell wall biosynthesis
MQILILNWRDPKNPKSGGAECVTLKHAAGWAKAGHQVTWLASAYTGSLPEEKIQDVKIIRKWGAYTVYLYAPYFWFLNHKKFDLIIDQVHGIPFFTPVYAKKPVIVFIHEVAGEIWDKMFPFPVNYLGKLLEIIYFKIYSDYHFWTVSRSTAEELKEKGISENQITVIESAVENTPLPVHKKSANPTYIFISRLVKMKGIEDVIKAFRIISQKQKNAVLWVVGSGNEKYINILKQNVTVMGLNRRVIFWGFTADKQKFELLNKAHILLHASVKEGWGLVVKEAQSQGTPAVVYNVPGLRDSVASGETGIILERNTPAEMADQSVSLYNDRIKYQKMSGNCIKWALKNSWKDSIRASLDLINRIYKREHADKNE